MKRVMVNILCSTGITLLLLAMIAILSGAKFLFLSSVFECFGVNIIIHAGLILTNKFESSYPVLEYILDIGYTIAVVLLFGFLFHWYSTTSVWILIIMSVIVYGIGILLSVFRMRQEIEEINSLIQKRNQEIT